LPHSRGEAELAVNARSLSAINIVERVFVNRYP
jgi:hypothetical protein